MRPLGPDFDLKVVWLECVGRLNFLIVGMCMVWNKTLSDPRRSLI